MVNAVARKMSKKKSSKSCMIKLSTATWYSSRRQIKVRIHVIKFSHETWLFISTEKKQLGTIIPSYSNTFFVSILALEFAWFNWSTGVLWKKALFIVEKILLIIRKNEKIKQWKGKATKELAKTEGHCHLVDVCKQFRQLLWNVSLFHLSQL